MFTFLKKLNDRLNGCQNPFPFIKNTNGTIDYNLTRKDEYYIQRNNKYYPVSSCNTTSLANGIIGSGMFIRTKNGIQPEDKLTKLLETKEAFETAERLTPWFTNGKGELTTDPRLIAIMLAWAAHKLMGKKICAYTSNGRIQDMLFNMIKFKGCTVGLGSFTPAGHYVCFCGFKTNQADIGQIESPDDVKIEEIIHLIMDDPWGDFRTNYRVHNGNDIPITIDRYMDLMWGEYNNKYLIYIRETGFVIDEYKINQYPI